MFEHDEFFGGMITMGMLVCAAFFFRFWLRSKDSLFLAFSLAFLLLSLSHALVAILQIPVEERSWLYLLRLASYSLLVYAILRKNAPRGAQHKPESSVDDKRSQVSMTMLASCEAFRAFEEIGRYWPATI